MIAPRPRLVIATTCADRKAVVAGSKISLRDVDGRGPRDRARRWAAALRRAEAQGGRDTADRVYQGDHWSSSRRAFDNAAEAGFNAEMWVISAGYGLYPANHAVASYAATLTPGHEDSVAPQGMGAPARRRYLAEWWNAVSEHVTVEDTDRRRRIPRSFTELAEKDPDVSIVVISGGAYLDAITEDLCEASTKLTDIRQLVVICSGAKRRETHVLKEVLLPVDARFQHEVNGTRGALNARIAAKLLGALAAPENFDFEWCRTRVDRWAADLPETIKYDRTPGTDAEVKRWIREHRGEYDKPSASRMLRAYRDANLACEQKRFGSLFKAVMGQNVRR